MTDKSKVSNQTKHIPKDAQVVMSIMKDMGIVDYEPRVINQLLEFTYRYVTFILDDARVFANHAKKKTIDLEDVRLAVQMQMDKSFTTPPPREVLLEVARTKNVTPLPLIKPHCGLRLPPDRYCLSGCNYKLVKAHITKKTAIKGIGAGNKSGKGGNQMMMKRQANLVTVSKTQPANAPKPVFKFTSANKVLGKPLTMVVAPEDAVVKMETDESQGAGKRKREDDDYDVL